MLSTSSPPAQTLSPSSMARVLRAAMCKNSFRAPLTTTLFLLKPSCSLFTPIPLEIGTHMAPVRWRNETIPFGIRKTGLKPLAEESQPLRSALSTVSSCDAVLFPVQLPWLQFPPANSRYFCCFSSAKFFPVPIKRRTSWEEVNQWLIEYDWRSNESYPSYFFCRPRPVGK